METQALLREGRADVDLYARPFLLDSHHTCGMPVSRPCQTSRRPRRWMSGDDARPVSNL